MSKPTIVIESIDPPIMDVTGCLKCGATCGHDVSMEWRIAFYGKPTAVRLCFCTPCAIAYLAADVMESKEFEREIGARLEQLTADLNAAAIAGPAAGGMQ